MAWIESHQDLLHHPKTQKLARILCVSLVTAIGHLHCLWWWAVDYAEDGDLSRFDALDIAIGGEWEGEPEEFTDALIFVGFIDANEGSRAIHNWDKYFGRLLEQRQANARRQREWRERHKDETQTSETRNGDITVTERSRTGATVPNPTVPNHTEPKNGSLSFAAEKTKKPTPISADFEVDDEMTNWALAKGFSFEEIDEQTERFQNHALANNRKQVDWKRSWQNWLTSPLNKSHTPKTANGFGPKGPDAAYFAKKAVELERQGR